MKTFRSARVPRFYHDGNLQAESDLELSKKASHHLITVLKTRVDDRIDLFNGDGNNYEAVLIDTGQNISGRRARLHINAVNAANTESPVSITLVQAISRGDRMDASIRQAVELGVTAIQPVYSRHSAKPLDEKRTQKKWEHWQNIVVSACEQSGRAMLPTLGTPTALGEWLTMPPATTAVGQADKRTPYFILAPKAKTTLGEYLKINGEGLCECGIIIGPESGFDDDEIVTATSNGAVAVQLGARILRTETAGPASIAIVQSHLGDLK